MNGVATWIAACRPATLVAALVPVAVGTACAFAAGGLRPGPALAATLGAVAIQIGTNLVNDVSDAERGADTAARLGPVRAVQAGLLSARAVRQGAVVAFLVAVATGVYLATVAGPIVVAIGLASVAAGVAYTAGPYPLGYHGLGDPFVLVFFGFVAVGGTTFVQVGTVPALAWWCALPVGALATAILVVNNVRDRATDLMAGKRTLAVRLGRRAAVCEYGVLVALAYAVPMGLVVLGDADPWLLLPLVSLPLALPLLARVAGGQGRELNPVLVATARLLLVHGSLLAAGIALGAR